MEMDTRMLLLEHRDKPRYDSLDDLCFDWYCNEREVELTESNMQEARNYARTEQRRLKTILRNLINIIKERERAKGFSIFRSQL